MAIKPMCKKAMESCEKTCDEEEIIRQMEELSMITYRTVGGTEDREYIALDDAIEAVSNAMRRIADKEQKKTNYDVCCESMESMAAVIDVMKVGWSKEEIREWLSKEVCMPPEKHHIKILPTYFGDVASGVKKFEIRKADRNYKVGDVLRLCEWTEENGYTGREIEKTVTYILRGCPDYGLKDGYWIMGWM